ncbi:Oidioi.mRNA.OKI2018_I69.chr2.g6313.t1.cds [Oikopleura dioica]|uniref:Oidioi.mRNA.OKI2018_I69.chr2.g6313.t1.cds n=1 Tax=Oikopleura dioica TaxID=34765 RepID=A0ABN7T7D2_OIKDI|nr:Oidioi.mRNA.OKI2018_I69.chr2.g6313.t1.cds [Oikopleura dioica]
MKFLGTVLSSTFASHYRAGSYQYRQDGGNLQVTRTMGWRRGMDGYGTGCTDADVASQSASGSMITESITDMSGIDIIAYGNNGTTGKYIVNEIEDSAALDSGVHYCFGYVDETFNINQPFKHVANGCCTISMHDDDGSLINGDYNFASTVYDLTNNSPQFKIPAIWYIMTGCTDQKLFLNPSDPDGDNVKCRWATIDEAEALSRDQGRFDSLILDEENCIVTYDPSADAFASGIKPLAIQVEDYDVNGNLRSSVPAQFMATVWTPSMASSIRSEIASSGEKFFANLFGEDHSETGHHRGRRQASNDHCTGLPAFTGTSPQNGDIIKVSGSISLDYYAEYTANGNTFVDLDRIIFSGPSGMTCTDVDKTSGHSNCSWTPTLFQLAAGSHDLCAIAYDPMQRTSDRLCVKLIAEPAKSDMQWWLSALAPDFSGTALTDYGCTGRGLLEPFAHNNGRPVDEVDLAINGWKKCVRCSVDVLKLGTNTTDLWQTGFWEYPQPTDNVCDASDAFQLAICECDKAFATVLSGYSLNPMFQNFDNVNCLKAQGGIEHESKCCGTSVGSFQLYNAPSDHCCEGNQLKPAGTCASENGLTYTGETHMYHRVEL